MLCMMIFITGQLSGAAYNAIEQHQYLPTYDPTKHVSDSNRHHVQKLINILNTATPIDGPKNDDIAEAISKVYENLKNTIDLKSLSNIFTQLYNTYERKPNRQQDLVDRLLAITLEINQLQEQEKNSPENIASDLADLLIEQSYFSPEMQYAVTSYMNNGLFEVNVLTGKVHNIPKVTEIVEGKLNADGVRDPYSDEVGRKNALHAALEATKTAKFLAGLNAAYAMPDNNMMFAPTLHVSLTASLDENLIRALDIREDNLKAALGYDNSWWQWITDWSLWIPKSLTSMIYTTPTRTRIATADTPNLTFNPYQRNPQADDIIVRIPDSVIKSIIKTNADYKQKINTQEAANLLFKQCFIAQQTFDEDARLQVELNEWPLYCMPTKSPISATNYIFDQFEIAPRNYANTIDLLCNKITAAGFCNHNKAQLHVLLLQIRKAVQTAMFIANKDSGYNAGYKFSSGIIQYLDKIIGHLSIYDNRLDALSKNPDFGGSRNDVMRSVIWNRISTIARGAAAIGVIGVAAVGIYGAVGAVGSEAKNAYHGIFGNPAAKAAADKAAADKALADKVAAEVGKNKTLADKITAHNAMIEKIATHQIAAEQKNNHQTNNQQISDETTDNEENFDDTSDDTTTNPNPYIDAMQNKLLNFFQGVVSEGKEIASNFKDTTTKNFISSMQSENNKTREIDKADPDYLYRYQTPDNFDYGVGAAAAAYALSKGVTAVGNSAGTAAGQGVVNGLTNFGKTGVIQGRAIPISNTTNAKTAFDGLKNSNVSAATKSSTIDISNPATAGANLKNAGITPGTSKTLDQLKNQNSTIDISNPATAGTNLKNAGIIPPTGPGTYGATFAGTSSPIHHKVGATFADGQPVIAKTATDKFIEKIPFGVKAGVGAGLIATPPADIDIASNWPIKSATENDQLQNDAHSQVDTAFEFDSSQEQLPYAYNPPA